MFSTAVEKWRPLVGQQSALLNIYAPHDPATTLLNAGLDLPTFIEYVLGIINKEAYPAGNEFTLGDLKPGFQIPHQPTSLGEAMQYLDGVNSLGLMQLNYGAGTPQGVGYQGDKAGLLDPAENILRGELYFLQQLYIYKNVQEALSAYNAGHSSQLNIASYVDPIINTVKAVLTAATEKKTSSRPLQS